MTLLELGTHEFPPGEVQGRGDGEASCCRRRGDRKCCLIGKSTFVFIFMDQR
jgi:hypothetical protein